MQGQLSFLVIFIIETVAQPKAMMHAFIFLSLLAASLAMPEKQVQLEDIENDNLKNDRRSKLPMKLVQVSGMLKTSPPMQYGFRPMKIQHQPTQQTQYEPQQQYYVLPQQYVMPKYYAYQTNSPLQYQYQQEQLAYITNNHLPQQFYTPQYVFVNPDISNNIRNALNHKLALTYIQPHYVQPEQNVETVQQASPTYQIQYVAVPQTQQTPKFQYNFESAPKHRFSPKSLLDSYVPSYLQIQYLNQQQARENAIPQTKKILSNLKKTLARTWFIGMHL